MDDPHKMIVPSPRLKRGKCALRSEILAARKDDGQLMIHIEAAYITAMKALTRVAGDEGRMRAHVHLPRPVALRREVPETAIYH